MKTTLTAVALIGTALLAASPLHARTFDFKSIGSKGSSSGRNGYWWETTEKTKSSFYQVKVGSASKNDSRSKMEIRAATVFKSAKDRRTGINDVATLSFDPINTSKAIYFVVATGTATARTDRFWADEHRNDGWQVAGCIIEIWQDGKAVKHWTNLPGNGGKTKLTDGVKQLRIGAKGYEQNGDYAAFDNATEIFAVNAQGEKVELEDMLSEFRQQAQPDAKETTKAEQQAEGESAARFVDRNEFTLKKFCGYEFGTQRPELEDKVIKMKKPFRHYDTIRPCYGKGSGKLIALRLESRKGFADDAERMQAVAGAAAVFEKKYGIALDASDSSYSFSNNHVCIWITAHCIEVRNRELESQERFFLKSMKDAAGGGANTPSANDGADVL